MGVAGAVAERLEFAKHRDVGSGPEHFLEFGQGSDFMAQQVIAEGLGIEGDGAHNDRVPTVRKLRSELYHNKTCVEPIRTD